jgi:3-oxoacyl-[acyl-carrier protein] reductase
MGMAKNLALKLAPDGISVNDVAPAMIGETGMIPDAKFVENTPGDVRNIPVGRLGTPNEVGNVVTMLCRTGYLTGQSIVISGGLK